MPRCMEVQLEQAYMEAAQCHWVGEVTGRVEVGNGSVKFQSSLTVKFDECSIARKLMSAQFTHKIRGLEGHMQGSIR